MNLKGITPILNVSNIEESIAWFESLGWSRCWTWNESGMIEDAAEADANGVASFAAVGCQEQQIFLCRDGQGGRDEPGDLMRILASLAEGEDAGSGVWMSWWLESPAEVDAIHELAKANGVKVIAPPTDEPWGVRECRVRHPDGHIIRLSAGIAEG